MFVIDLEECRARDPGGFLDIMARARNDAEAEALFVEESKRRLADYRANRSLTGALR